MTSLLDWVKLLGKSSMRKVPTPSGRFAFQLFFDDLGEIDEICLQALKRQSLLPPTLATVRIERFVEKQFRTALRYEELGPDICAARFSILRARTGGSTTDASLVSGTMIR